MKKTMENPDDQGHVHVPINAQASNAIPGSLSNETPRQFTPPVERDTGVQEKRAMPKFGQTAENMPLRRSTRKRTSPVKYQDYAKKNEFVQNTHLIQRIKFY